ncbi:MAG: hypothetical protein M3198_02810, partial [Actinomycetota bacterium]|nr:hypothetical protein [Actinomycetota bacterium]
IVKLARTPDLRHNFNLWLWKRVMRSRAARDDVVAMLDAVFNPNPGNIAERKKMLRFLLKGGRPS